MERFVKRFSGDTPKSGSLKLLDVISVHQDNRYDKVEILAYICYYVLYFLTDLYFAILLRER